MGIYLMFIGDEKFTCISLLRKDVYIKDDG